MVHTGIHRYDDFVAENRTGRYWLVRLFEEKTNFVSFVAARIDEEVGFEVIHQLIKDYTGEVYWIDADGKIIGDVSKKTQFAQDLTDVWEMDESEFREIHNQYADIASEQEQLTKKYKEDMLATVDRHDVLSVLNHRCE